MGTVAIRDTMSYANRMEGSMAEKLFFLSHIPNDSVSSIVDFGCADGCLFQAMRKLGCNLKQVGIDNEPEFKELFTLRNPDAVWIQSKFPVVRDMVDPKKCILNLSSVIHEVYSYMDPKEVELFWKSVFESGFKYITIRDMITTDNEDEAASIFDLVQLNNQDVFRKQKEDYEALYGKITTRRNLYHFLLKYRYTENWERELRENYLPLTEQALIEMIPDEYEVVYERVYTNPFIEVQTFNDFGIRLSEPTHIQMILRHIGNSKEN